MNSIVVTIEKNQSNSFIELLFITNNDEAVQRNKSDSAVIGVSYKLLQ